MIKLAAIRVGDVVYTGKRHAWIMKHIRELVPDIKYIELEDQGFVTDDGTYISDRHEAARIAIECGQITEMKYPAMGLDSSEVCEVTESEIFYNMLTEEK
jgi:hypothetical protein